MKREYVYMQYRQTERIHVCAEEQGRDMKAANVVNREKTFVK
jgi:hypothetical protein